MMVFAHNANECWGDSCLMVSHDRGSRTSRKLQVDFEEHYDKDNEDILKTFYG